MTRKAVSKPMLLVVVLFCLITLASAQSNLTLSQHPLPQQYGNAWQLTTGPDGAIWYTVSCPWAAFCGTSVVPAIGRLTTGGAFTEYPLPSPSSGSTPYGITAGPDGALWFTDIAGKKIGRITTGGQITEYPLPTPAGDPYLIIAGPDGALWFTELNASRIGRITTAGVITEFFVAGGDALDIVVGPDDAMWFTNLNGWIGRIDTQGRISKYPLPTLGAFPYGLTKGPDGAIWIAGFFGNYDSLIWRLTMDGTFSTYAVPTKTAGVTHITSGSDGALWFNESWSKKLGRITTDGVFTEYSVTGLLNEGPVPITRGPDGAIWLGTWGYIDRVTLSQYGTTLASSLTPSTYGQNVTFTARVTTSGPVRPTGTVAFMWKYSTTTYKIGTASLNSAGVATLTKSDLNAGQYPMIAVYRGDTNNLSSTSPVMNQTVLQTTSRATIMSSANPSMVGQAVTLTAKFTSPTVIPSGPVTFKAGTTVLGTAQLNGGKAVFTTSTLPAGSTVLKVIYNGNSNIKGSSASITQIVQP